MFLRTYVNRVHEQSFDAQKPAACQYCYPCVGTMIDLFIRALAPERTLGGYVTGVRGADVPR
jgi:hypothetical protein